MTARSEIEHRNLYYKRRASCSGLYGAKYSRDEESGKERAASSATLDESSSTSTATPQKTPYGNRRVKSTSVCVGTLQLEGERRFPRAPPRTLNDFQFLNPEILTMQNYEVQIIRPPALSTSEIFNEPPPLYVYRAVPALERKRRSYYSTNSGENSKISKIRAKFHQHKHTVVAWLFGFLAISLCVAVVVCQTWKI
ncbi:unnamed protein product [Caenorhabditis angaria]|uniref:Uncharacterized protein n=1 Tax=Caenorhabditis angaria TaxID=860376 RepID=A0A9P1IS02_9PELO|nr:unnamed protein product [Caenorhabditis angaria]